MHAAARAGDLSVGIAEDRVERAGVGVDGRPDHPGRWPAGIASARRGAAPAIPAATASSRLAAAEVERALYHPLRLPRLHVTQLVGKLRGIRRRAKRFSSQNRGGLVLSVAIARGAGET